QADSIARTLDPELDPIALLEDEARDLMLFEAERNLQPDQLLSTLFTQLGPLAACPAAWARSPTDSRPGRSKSESCPATSRVWSTSCVRSPTGSARRSSS